MSECALYCVTTAMRRMPELQAVGQREIDDPVFPAEMDGGIFFASWSNGCHGLRPRRKPWRHGLWGDIPGVLMGFLPVLLFFNRSKACRIKGLT